MIYEYRCSGCETQHEAQQSVKEGETYVQVPQTCPNCGGQHLQLRLISKSSFALKGSGWYKDSYR